MTSTRKNAPKTRGKPFAPGNPGRPRGARHKTTQAIETLLAGQAEALTQRAISAALGGDGMALRLCLERLAPARREAAVNFALPPVTTGADVPAALASVLAAVAAGELTPGEGAAVAGLVEKFRGAFELADLESRIAAIEAREGLAK